VVPTYERGWDHLSVPRTGLEQHGYVVLGAWLCDSRQRAGLTQRHLGALAGVSQSVISRLENGKQYGISLRRLGILIAVLDERDRRRRFPSR